MHPLKSRIQHLVQQHHENCIALEEALCEARKLAASPEIFRQDFGYESWESFQSSETRVPLRFQDAQVGYGAELLGGRTPRVLMSDPMTGLPYYVEVNEDGY